MHVTRRGCPSGWWRSCGALPVGPIMALLLLVPRAGTAAISAGPTIDVPWLQSVFGEVTAAVLADGSFAVASLHLEDGAVEAQFFRATGDAQTRPLILVRPPAPPAGLAAAGVGSLGSRYFLVWQDNKLGPDGLHAIQHAYAALYGERGTPLGKPFPWPSSDIDSFARHYRFGGAPRWRFLPITYDFLFTADDETFYRPLLRVADPGAAPLGRPVELGPPLLSNVEDAAINGSGRFVVVSDQCSSFPPPVPPCVRGMQIFDDAVTPLTPFLTAGVTQSQHSVVAAIDPLGQVLLAWITDEGRFMARLYDRNGSPASDELQVVAVGEHDVIGGDVKKGLDDGSFVFFWILYPDGDSNRGTLVVDRFDPRTRTFEEPVVIAQGPIAGALLELNGAGQGVVVWQTENTGSGPLDREGHMRVIRVSR
jgi:hypothetical protein